MIITEKASGVNCVLPMGPLSVVFTSLDSSHPRCRRFRCPLSARHAGCKCLSPIMTTRPKSGCHVRRGAGLPVGPHGGPPLGEVRDAPLLLVAQAHHVELADAVALRAVYQPLAVG